jgi:hypothetical protein
MRKKRLRSGFVEFGRHCGSAYMYLYISIILDDPLICAINGMH